MLTFENLKEFLILSFTFGIIYLFQYVDDKKRCKKRDGIYDNVKLPLLASAIVGLVLFWNSDTGMAFMNAPTLGAPTPRAPTLSKSVPSAPVSGVSTIGTSRVNPDFVVTNQTGGNIHANNLEVYTDLPEW